MIALILSDLTLPSHPQLHLALIRVSQSPTRPPINLPFISTMAPNDAMFYSELGDSVDSFTDVQTVGSVF